MLNQVPSTSMGKRSPSLSSEIQTVGVEQVKKEPENTKIPIWGTFHFIAKSDQDMPLNTCLLYTSPSPRDS